MSLSVPITDAAESPYPTGDHRLFLRALDVLSEGLAFFDLSARLLHANQAFRDAVEDEATGSLLRLEIRHFVEMVCAAIRQQGQGFVAEEYRIEKLMEWDVSTSPARYRLQGSHVGPDFFGSGATVLVTLQRSGLVPLSEEVLQERFGLSRSEGRVARMIAAGRSNEQIAQALGISSNTARNHTSRILSKLKVRSRAEVGPRLRGE